jgi:RNA polymerase sigma-32 factor
VNEAWNRTLSRTLDYANSAEQLDRETELELIRAWQKHADKAACERLIRANLRHVASIALRYRRYGVPVSELIAEGNFGLMHALGKFNPDLGNRFVTYAAYWIRAYVLGYVLRTWSLVGGGSGALRSKVFFKLRRERVRLMNLTGDAEEAERVLADRLGVPQQTLQRMLQRLESRDLSLDLKVFDDSTTRLIDRLTTSETNQEDDTIHKELMGKLKSQVSAALGELDAREQFIVHSRLLAHPEDELSLAEIGRKLGVSRERARQLEERAKGKLKKQLAGQGVVGELVSASQAEELDEPPRTTRPRATTRPPEKQCA